MSCTAHHEPDAHAQDKTPNDSLPFPTEASCVSVQEGYARWAHTYDQTPNPLLALEERCLTPLLPDLAGKNVLDLACGTGRWLFRLLTRGALSGGGIDLSPSMLNVGAARPAIRGRLALADCLRLPFCTGAFDFVLCSFALIHIGNLDAMARELAWVIKRHGQLLMCDLHPDAYALGWRPGFRDPYGPAQIETVYHPAESVVSCFRSHGFSIPNLYTFFFEEPERQVFFRAGRAALFEKVCRVPAVQVYDFRRLAHD